MPHLSRLSAALAVALLAATAAHAQVRSVRPAPSTAPSASTRAATVAPNPAGLRPLFPAGVSSGSGAAVSSDPVAAGTAVTGSDAAINAQTMGPSGVETGLYNPAAANAMGASGSAGARGPGQYIAGGTSGFSAVDIARSFLGADANRDGSLTPAEARRLTISMMSFEEMDRNFDGLVSRSEYEDGLR